MRFHAQLDGCMVTTLRPLLIGCTVAVLLFLPCLAHAQISAPQHSSNAAAMSGMESSGMGSQVLAHAMLNQFEGRTNGPNNQLRWDGEAWIGNDMNKLWLKSEGFGGNNAISDGDHEALYDRPIPRMRYFDAQIGVRADLDSGPARTWAAIGIEGLAPYYFEFAPTLYVRDGGHVAGRLAGSFEMLITQRWIVEPEVELNFYNKDDTPRGIGSGLSDLDAGLRLRYEINRKFAPYIGFAYDGKYGGTANYARQAGERPGAPRLVFGLRLWY